MQSRENIKLIKDKFGGSVTVNLLVKNTDNTNGRLYINIKSGELDSLVGEHYTEEDLIKLL